MTTSGGSASLIDFESAGFMEGLNAAIEAVAVESRSEQRAAAARIATRAKGYLNPHRETGALAAAIGIKSGSDARGPYVDVGVVDDVVKVMKISKAGATNTKYRKARGAEGVSVNEYGHYLEYGTKHEPPYPFLRPAVAEEVGAGGALPVAIIHGPRRATGSTYRAKGAKGVL